MRTIKFIVDRHSDGYLAYPLGLRGVVMGQGDSYEEALLDAKSAAQAQIEAFGVEARFRAMIFCRPMSEADFIAREYPRSPPYKGDRVVCGVHS